VKGIVFKEFADMLEATFGADMYDSLVEACDLPSGGVYTAVGTYDHTELVALVVELSKRTGLDATTLVQAFGKYLFGRFNELFPVFFNHDNAFSFLESIENVIHVEVLKLYPEATLPRFDSEIADDGNTMHLTYYSTRHFADLAIGLIQGTFEHWGEEIQLSMEDLTTDEEQKVRFTMVKA